VWEETMSSTLESGLIENALDFLLSSAENASEGKTKRNWKYTILHLFAGAELSLKAVLQKEHWSLLFADIDQASEQALKKAVVKSVDPNAAFGRNQKGIADSRLQISEESHLESVIWNPPRCAHGAGILRRKTLRKLSTVFEISPESRLQRSSRISRPTFRLAETSYNISMLSSVRKRLNHGSGKVSIMF
jgi:hypothetical protein